MLKNKELPMVIVKAEGMEETGWSNIIEFKNNVLHFQTTFDRELAGREQQRTQKHFKETEGPDRFKSLKKKQQAAQADGRVEEAKQLSVEKTSVKEELAVDQVSVTAMKKNGKGKVPGNQQREQNGPDQGYVQVEEPKER